MTSKLPNVKLAGGGHTTLFLTESRMMPAAGGGTFSTRKQI